VFDRRAKDGNGGRITIHAHVFNIAWSDGLSSEMVANPDIGDLAAVTAQAERHAKIVGLLPHCLRSLLDRIVLHGGNVTMGGGNRSLLLYSEKTMQHETQKGKLHEIIVHEAAHNLGQTMEKSPEWLAAQYSDNAFISKYAQDFPLREDVSESFLAWLILRYHRHRITEEQANTISSQIPARLKYFDERNYNMFPVAADAGSTEPPQKSSIGFQPMHRGTTSGSDGSPVRSPTPLPPKAWAGSPCYLPDLSPFTFHLSRAR